MTLRQTKKFALRVLIGWHRPPVVATVTVSDGGGITLQTLFDAMAEIRGRPQPPPVVLMSPQMVEMFAETTVNSSLYGTINIIADPTAPLNEAYLIQPPIP